jgi:hypothetical protein
MQEPSSLACSPYLCAFLLLLILLSYSPLCISLLSLNFIPHSLNSPLVLVLYIKFKLLPLCHKLP